MPKSHNGLLRALNPIRYPKEATIAPAVILYRRIQGGALEANPYGTYATIKWILHRYTRAPVVPTSPGLEVGSIQSDADGFAIYGLVRVGGTSVVPPC